MSWGIILSSILCKKCTHVPVVDTSKLWFTAAADQQQTGSHHCGRTMTSEQCALGSSVKSRQEIKANTWPKTWFSWRAAQWMLSHLYFTLFLVPTIARMSLPRISTSLPEMSWAKMCVSMQDTACSLYPSSVSWIHCAWAEPLPGMQIYQLWLLSLPRNSVQTKSERHVPIWPEFLDVQQSRSDISSQKMRQNQENSDTWQQYLLWHRWTGCILSWKTHPSFHLHFNNF